MPLKMSHFYLNFEVKYKLKEIWGLNKMTNNVTHAVKIVKISF